MSNVKFTVIEFKSYPYHWNLTREGRKTFDLRLVHPEEGRFRHLKQWLPGDSDWLIKLVNTETEEYLYYKIVDVLWEQPAPGWVIIMLGKEIKEE